MTMSRIAFADLFSRDGVVVMKAVLPQLLSLLRDLFSVVIGVLRRSLELFGGESIGAIVF